MDPNESLVVSANSSLIKSVQNLRTTHWQDTPSPSRLHGLGVVQRLFQNCSNLCLHLLQSTRQEERIPVAQRDNLHESNSILCLWGNDFGVLEGELDTVLLQFNELRECVLSFLRSILILLSKRLSRYTKSYEGVLSNHNLLQKFNVSSLLEEAEAAMSGPFPNDDDYSELATNSEDDSPEDALEDLRIYLQCLVDLGPSIELCVQSVQDSDFGEPMLDVLQSRTHNPPHFYSNLIHEKFPAADESMIEQLGELNWERCCRIRACMEANIEQEVIVNVDEIAPSVASRSQFHDSGIGSSLPTQSLYARTVASISKTISSGTFQSRIPPLSEAARSGVPFSCVGCGRLVKATSTRDYFNHVYKDIQPYVCFYENMPCNGTAFDNRDTWIDHIHSDHGFAPRWESIECPLCSQMIPEGRKSILHHLSRHMESIAEAALPLDADSEENSSASSANASEDRMDVILEDEPGPDNVTISTDEPGLNPALETPPTSEKSKTKESYTKKDFPHSLPTQQWFQPGEGIAREVITADIQRYLGPTALVRPGEGIAEYEGVRGYWVTAHQTLTSQMVQDLRLDSQRWRVEVQQGRVAYQDSRTHRSRQYYGPSASSATVPHAQPTYTYAQPNYPYAQPNYPYAQPTQAQQTYTYGQPTQTQSTDFNQQPNHPYVQSTQAQQTYTYGQPSQTQSTDSYQRPNYPFAQPTQAQQTYAHGQPSQMQSAYSYAQPENGGTLNPPTSSDDTVE